MILRRQLPVSSPLSARALAMGLSGALWGGARARDELTAELCTRFSAESAVLTDSGTSALVIALRLSAGAGGTVAFPAYGCVDLAAAAELAGVRVRLYDLDPITLSPDLESVRAVLQRGADAIVVTHLYGYPADVPAVASIAAETGAGVIEDAAQGAAGSLAGRMLGSFGPLSVLSFGRGKGMTGGGGGALLAIGPGVRERVTSPAKPSAERQGWSELGAAGIQWLLGRPALYALPSALPWLHLGEMVYHPAVEPRAIGAAAAAIVRLSVQQSDAAAARRRERAEALLDELPATVSRTEVLPGGTSGMLRLPLRITNPAPSGEELGIVRGYPRTLFEQPELRPLLRAGENEHPGAKTLRRLLHTVPVHDFVTPGDRKRIVVWLRRCDSSH